MARWFRSAVLVCSLSAPLLVACTGGQTGQPTRAAACPPVNVSADEPVHGITPSELARLFEGRYTSALRWLLRSSGPSEAGSSLGDDEITVGITYQGANGTTHCEADLEVEVAVDMTTRDTGVHETGSAILSAPAGSTELGTFAFTGVRVDAI